MGQLLRRRIGSPLRPDLSGALVDCVSLPRRRTLFIGNVKTEFGLGAFD
jgi:hypothetical protein